MYAPLTEGWWHVYVHWLNEGRIPYRDFEFLLPPGYLYVLRFTILVFGEQVETLRLVGGTQVGLIGLLIHLLLKRTCGEYASAVIALITVTYIRSGPVFVSYDYHYLSMLLFLIVVWGVSLLETTKRQERILSKEWSGIGVATGIALSVKQSQGIWTLVTLVIVLVTFNLRDPRKLIYKLVWIVLGIAAIWIPILVWFQLKGVATSELLRQLSLPDRPKGSVREMFFGWIRDVLSYEQRPFGVRRAFASLSQLVQFVAWFPILATVLMWFRKRSAVLGESSSKVSLFALTTFLCGWWWSNGSNRPFHDLLLTIWSRFLQIAPIGSSLLVLILYLILRIARPPNERLHPELALVISTVAVVWACGMSAGITEIGAYLPVAVSLAFFVRLANRHSLSIALVTVLLIAALTGSWQYRMTHGFYSWWGYKTPAPLEATEEFEVGLMRGLRTAPQIKREYSRILEFLRGSPACDGEVIVFPHLASILVDSDLTPGGRLGTYWYDFASESAVRDEVSRIGKSAIKAVVILELSTSVLQMHEEMFNEGQYLAHRELLELLRRKSQELNQVVSTRVDSESVLNAWFSDCVVTSLVRD